MNKKRLNYKVIFESSVLFGRPINGIVQFDYGNWDLQHAIPQNKYLNFRFRFVLPNPRKFRIITKRDELGRIINSNTHLYLYNCARGTENPNWQRELDRLMTELHAKGSLGLTDILNTKIVLASIESEELRDTLKLLFDRRLARGKNDADTQWVMAMYATGLEPEVAVGLWTKKEEIAAFFQDSVRGIIDRLQDSGGEV